MSRPANFALSDDDDEEFEAAPARALRHSPLPLVVARGATVVENVDSMTPARVRFLSRAWWLRVSSKTGIAELRAHLQLCVEALNNPPGNVTTDILAPRRAGWTKRKARTGEWESAPFVVEGARFVWVACGARKPEGRATAELYFVEPPAGEAKRPPSPPPALVRQRSAPPEEEDDALVHELCNMRISDFARNCTLAGIHLAAEVCPVCHQQVARHRAD